MVCAREFEQLFSTFQQRVRRVPKSDKPLTNETLQQLMALHLVTMARSDTYVQEPCRPHGPPCKS